MSSMGLELRTRIDSSGELELSLEEVVIPEPAPDEVLIRVEASPINPSDIGLLLGPADLSTLHSNGHPSRPRTTATVAPGYLAGLAARIGQSLPAGSEGAGVVVAAGSNARALVGRVVTTQASGMYAQFRIVRTTQCLVLPEGTPAKAGASAFINPLTVLGMVETMRREGHVALVHTAAASNLGQMLNRVCKADGIPLVNIVRSNQQVNLLRSMGASHVLNSSDEDFERDLTQALYETGATLAFDAIGGGTLAATILTCMETAAGRKTTVYSRYGSPIHKQVYAYGALDKRPMEIARKFGMAWGVGGWLVTWYLEKMGPENAQRLRDRVAAELTTTFASSYVGELTLQEALSPDAILKYSQSTTGGKYLIVPNA